MESFDASHICGGRSLISSDDIPDLCANEPLWQALWSQHREDLLAGWIKSYPGTRPAAWWEFDYGNFPEQSEEETDVEYLHRVGLIDAAEMQAIAAQAKELAHYNSVRHPQDRRSNWIQPEDIELFAVSHGLLTDEEIEILTRK
jgi:hypothetical protein